MIGRAETLLMRQSGQAGRAGQARNLADCRWRALLLRCAAQLAETDLAGVVAGAGIAAQDPSNANPDFNRVPVRLALAKRLDRPAAKSPPSAAQRIWQAGRRSFGMTIGTKW
jgi:hypothetical protein